MVFTVYRGRSHIMCTDSSFCIPHLYIVIWLIVLRFNICSCHSCLASWILNVVPLPHITLLDSFLLPALWSRHAVLSPSYREGSSLPSVLPICICCDSLPHPLRLDPTQSWVGWGITSTQNPLRHHISVNPLLPYSSMKRWKTKHIYLWQTEASLSGITGVSIKVGILSIPAGVAASKLTHLDSDCIKHYKHRKNI